mmetsp:Transcript_28702/g.72176  ORF Transcript_28702/g.72176 Transcript_28702/m.72176 type:complete len:85 (-) Transcript_28702:30-284(-)
MSITAEAAQESLRRLMEGTITQEEMRRLLQEATADQSYAGNSDPQNWKDASRHFKAEAELGDVRAQGTLASAACWGTAWLRTLH